MARYLIINADDFGLTEGVSRGILRAHGEGILTSTTFMVNFPWAEQMALLLAEAPGLGVGIHLNLTTGEPVLPADRVPTLVNRDGRLRKSLWHIMLRVSRQEAFAEWSAQAEKGLRLLGALGRRPTHLDTHRYLQAVPGLTEVMLAVAQKHGIPTVRCLRPDPSLRQAYPAWSPMRLMVEQALRRSERIVEKSGLAVPDTTMMGDFDLSLLLARLDRVGDGVAELITHPAILDNHLRALSSLQGQREVELAALVAPEARRRVQAHGIQLVSFAHLAT